MAEGKKYNAFSGVFTPSLLTILGVIMYMRLGWVVGEAGLIAALGIIVLAHVISVTTGLSISSIATDKKIKTGGIYYILSRSLGMPMGGAIGIALFIGTALSISLYLIGFAESFLAIDAIREFTGLAADINGFRIVGTVVILFLVIVAFISTSMAMKIQFFILITIALSLVSIALGFFQSPDISTSHISFSPNGDLPLEYIFAIFFPAVTGFTAGVAMSGDLKNPKSDIPKGTILAIGVGFMVYVVLAIAMSYFIPTDQLVSNYNILSKVAWLGPLVIAGVWGATLSSALGGILGGPRILQAISKDKMTPKIFGKGYGESNEPRNALLLIFFIAEAGILIGELDRIAEVVSMFYLASYGFINLSYVLEKWSSSDFRPTFKIHIAFGIVGFIASFGVMFKLNIAAMFASLLIMGLLYFLLKRKEIRSESGDVWQSVMGSIVRRTLAKLQGKTIEERNWKPNIILFSGGSKKRPHLLSFGKSIIGKYGILSNFDLHEKIDSNVLFTKYQQHIDDPTDDRGVFTRRQSCKNIYEGIESIAQTYGFSGVEPNTVLMGWGRQAKNPKRFAQMLNHLSTLDLNILLMDYDKTNGFGEKKQIDIWWRGSGSHGNLSLTLIKFLSNSLDWNNASIRLLIVNYENHKMEMISKRAEEYLENMRIDAELKIINNEIEQKPFYDIMKAESQASDLVFLGVPEIEKGKELEFVNETNNLMLNIGSVVLVKASTTFKDLHLGISIDSAPEEENEDIQVINKTDLQSVEASWPNNLIVSHELRLLTKNITDDFTKYCSSLYQQIHKDHHALIHKIEHLYEQSLDSIASRSPKVDQDLQIQLVNRQRTKLLITIHKSIELYTDTQLLEQGQLLETHLPLFIKDSKQYFSKLPKQLIIQYSKAELQPDINDTASQKRYKWWHRIWTKEQTKYKLQFNKLLSENMLSEYEPFLLQHFKHFGLMQVQFAMELIKLSQTIDHSFISLSDQFTKSTIQTDSFKNERKTTADDFRKIKQLNQEILDHLTQDFQSNLTKNSNKTCQLLNQIHPNSALVQDDEEKPKSKDLSPILSKIPKSFARNQKLIYNATTTEVRLLALKAKIKAVIQKLAQDTKRKLKSEVVNVYQNYLDQLKSTSKDSENGIDINAINITNHISNFYDESYRALNKTFTNFPEHIEIFEAEKLNNFEEKQFSNIASSEISAKQLIDYLIKNKIEAPLIKNLDQISHKVAESIASLNDAKRLISFAMSHHEEDEVEVENNPTETIKEGQTKILLELDKIEELKDNIDFEADRLFSEISQMLSYYSFVKTASNLKQYIHQQKKLNRYERLQSKFNQWVNYLKEQQANLIYTQSKALVLKKQMEHDWPAENSVKQLLDLSYQLTPDATLMEQLPFYYKQLFSSNQVLNKDFWIGREEEISKAKIALQRYESGHKGAIGIVGQTGVGKSFFSYYIGTLTQTPKILNILPQFDGTPSLEDLNQAFQKASEQDSSIESILESLPKGSLIIFENLEYWWSNAQSQDDVLSYIFELISSRLDQHLFIVNSNDIVYKQVLKKKQYSDIFLDLIHLGNITSRDLKEIVLSRHNTSGLKLQMNNKLFIELSETKLARLFNKIHKITGGNIEASLQLWLTSVQKFENQSIEIQLPEIDLQNLNSLDMDSRVILKQFVIHKRLNKHRLAQLIQEEVSDVKQKLQFLQRSGLIVKQKSHYQQNNYTKHYVTEFLIQKGMI